MSQITPNNNDSVYQRYMDSLAKAKQKIQDSKPRIQQELKTNPPQKKPIVKKQSGCSSCSRTKR